MLVSAAQADYEKGFAQGRAEGRADILLEQLCCRFGPLPAQVDTTIRALSLERLQEITPLVLTVQSLADLHLG